MNTNVLYWGDNLPLLRNRDYFPDESVDLVYLDPPFNSNASYNVLFKESSGAPSTAQLQAFADTWHWDYAAEKTWADLHAMAPKRVVDALEAFQKIIVLQEGRFARNDMMAYLVMMTARLLELHRVLKPTGSLYLHCDPTASHYLKIILDTIFGATNFRNEVVWKRTFAHGSSKRFGPVHDTILFFTKTNGYVWNSVYESYDSGYVENFYREQDEKGRYQHIILTGPGIRHGDSGEPWGGVNPTDSRRHWAIPRNLIEELVGQDASKHLTTQQKLDVLEQNGYIYWPPHGRTPRLKNYLDETKGNALQDIVLDIPPVAAQSKERMGYATQKPLPLLERIIQASSNEGDVVLDPFCGCGTAVLAAHKLNRRWIGIDVTNLAITVMRSRLRDAFPGIQVKVIGEPTTVIEADALSRMEPDGRWQFQWWAVGLVGALPASEPRRKGADAGIDGFFSVVHESDGKRETFRQVIVQVKSGHVSATHVRDLAGTIGTDKLGVFITLEEPTEPMKAAASAAGLYHNPRMDKHYPRIQVLTIAELLAGKGLNLPPRVGRASGPRISQRLQGEMLGQGTNEQEKPWT
ncbi:MAG: site-specific DNA-methyltransferase [Chloroflexi bacterium]|nr:site-specific DNA-methyltransferase [Chloroflexota bacterium]